MSSADEYDKRRDALLQIAVWQDSLLQSYRSINVTFQSLLLVAMTALLAIPSDGNGSDVWLVHLLTMYISLAFLIMIDRTHNKFDGLIRARGENVTYTHEQIILAENNLTPADRVFTQFKIEQGGNRTWTKEAATAKFLSGNNVGLDECRALVDGRLGHTRKTVDRTLFTGIWFTAILLMLVKAAIVALALSR